MSERASRLAALRACSDKGELDLIVIGGGATGCGIAVDAASRGLRVALVEKHDLAEGTSSHSTKLVHGGVRYLEMAVKKLDRGQYHLVREALRERATFLRNAPHLARRLPLVTPIYSWLEVPYVFSGLILYDLLAGSRSLGHSALVSRREALRRFPMLRRQGLKAGVMYYDGQFNDARMALTLALTAQEHGAFVANHCEAVALEKSGGRIGAVRVRDAVGGEEFTLAARGVINAAGPFVDSIRCLDEPEADPILEASSGIHIVLSARFSPPQSGLLIPKTEDGRVLFILPWQGHALIGTTDRPAAIVEHPQAREDEIDYLLRHINRYFDIGVQRDDVSAVWAGLRPLIRHQGEAGTAQLVREHLLLTSPSGLLTIAGGKWTSYRLMAEEAVDRAVAEFDLAPACACFTHKLRLAGGEKFVDPSGKLLAVEYGLDADVAYHLRHAYGDRAERVADLVRSGLGARLHAGHPFIEAEVVHASRHEFAEHAGDVLVRRMPLALLDSRAAQNAAVRVVELMAGEKGWDRARCDEELARCCSSLV